MRLHCTEHEQEGAMSKSVCNDTDDEAIFFDVSDDALERAGGSGDAIAPTLIGTYCFTCPSDQEEMS